MKEITELCNGLNDLYIFWSKQVIKKGFTPFLKKIWELLKSVSGTYEFKSFAATKEPQILEHLRYYAHGSPSTNQEVRMYRRYIRGEFHKLPLPFCSKLDVYRQQVQTFKVDDLCKCLDQGYFKTASYICSLDPHYSDLQFILLRYRSPGKKFLEHLEPFITNKEEIVRWSDGSGDLESLVYLAQHKKLVPIEQGNNPNTTGIKYLRVHGCITGQSAEPDYLIVHLD